LGATTFSTTTLSITTLSITTLSITTLSITTLSMTLSIMGLFAILSINDNQHNVFSVIMLSVLIQTVVMLSVLILTVVMLSVLILTVIMLSVVASAIVLSMAERRLKNKKQNLFKISSANDSTFVNRSLPMSTSNAASSV
jgi:hypothetical protein